MTEQEKYLEGHRNCGIKVGDRVRVARKAESEEGGWDNDWIGSMDEFIGKLGEVQGYGGLVGFKVFVREFQDYFHYPYFVLEKI